MLILPEDGQVLLLLLLLLLRLSGVGPQKSQNGSYSAAFFFSLWLLWLLLCLLFFLLPTAVLDQTCH